MLRTPPRCLNVLAPLTLLRATREEWPHPGPALSPGPLHIRAYLGFVRALRKYVLELWLREVLGRNKGQKQHKPRSI